MLVNSREMLKKARKEKKPIFQFNINNLEWTKAILEKCNELGSPVILGVSEGAVKYMGGYNVVTSLIYSLMHDLEITIDVCIHLDHSSSKENCIKAIDAGFNSVMIDMSSESLAENIKATKEVVSYAKNAGVSVEAELGSVGGSEDSEHKEAVKTKVEDAINFFNETGIDSFAPAVGNAHGIYQGKIDIDYDLIKKISSNLTIPIVLHGASGLSNEILAEAVKSGITKININTDLQVAWSRDVREFLIKNENVYDPRKIIKSGIEALKKEVENKVNNFR